MRQRDKIEECNCIFFVGIYFQREKYLLVDYYLIVMIQFSIKNYQMSSVLDESFSSSMANNFKKGQLRYKVVGSQNEDRLQLIKLLHSQAYDPTAKPIRYNIDSVLRQVKLKTDSPIKSNMLDIPVSAVEKMHENTCDGVLILMSDEEIDNDILKGKLQVGMNDSGALWRKESSDKKDRNDIREILKNYCRLLYQQYKNGQKLPKLILASSHNKDQKYNNEKENKERLQMIKNFIKVTVTKDMQTFFQNNMDEIIIDKIGEWRLQEIRMDTSSPSNRYNLQLIRQQLFECDFSMADINEQKKQEIIPQKQFNNYSKTGIIAPGRLQTQPCTESMMRAVKSQIIPQKCSERQMKQCLVCKCIIF